MDEQTHQLQSLLQAVHDAIAALDELTFLLHNALGSEEAVQAQKCMAAAIHHAARLQRTDHLAPGAPGAMN